ncbi:hypothetical protein [Phenylobacterium sp.]|uniref:hypothetical protein n=1 Tax=Phenylobacterium sp. TaxID=1871053 RepID=UPI003D2E8213
MPTYTVRRRVDAYVDYLAHVEADNPVEAAALAEEQDGDLPWLPDGVCEFDDRIFITLDAIGAEIAETEVAA